MVNLDKKTKQLIGLAVVVLVVSILAGVVGSVTTDRDEKCDCRKKTDGGWLGFSITWFILTLTVVPLVLWRLKILNLPALASAATLSAATTAGAFQ